MGSTINNPNNPWTPNAVIRDCSQGICSIYCPQWCYIIYTPPPPSALTLDDDDDSSAFQVSPLVVALIGILASAFVLITYYTIISRFCKRRRQIHGNGDTVDLNDDELAQAPSSSNSGLEESLIRSITVCKYKKGDGLVEGTDCSVCLSEFQESESLRLLPKCNHAFHLPCIDTWLKSHSSCPLCRSNIIVSTASSSALPNQRDTPVSSQEATQPSVNISALEYHHRNDTVIVIQNSEQEIQVGFGAVNGGNLEQRNACELNSCSSEGRLSVADILNANEDDDEVQIGIGREHEKRKVLLEC